MIMNHPFRGKPLNPAIGQYHQYGAATPSQTPPFVSLPLACTAALPSLHCQGMHPWWHWHQEGSLRHSLRPGLWDPGRYKVLVKICHLNRGSKINCISKKNPKENLSFLMQVGHEKGSPYIFWNQNSREDSPAIDILKVEGKMGSPQCFDFSFSNWPSMAFSP